MIPNTTPNSTEVVVKVQRSGRARTLSIGRSRENLAERIIFDCKDFADTYGDGVIVVLHKRPGDANPYPVAVEQDGSTAVWTIKNFDVAQHGVGNLEVQWHVGETIAKSAVFVTSVVKSMDESGEVPEYTTDWLEQIVGSGAKAKEYAIAASENAEAASNSAASAEASAQEANTQAENAKVLAQNAQSAEESSKENADSARESAEAANTSAHEAASSATDARNSAESAYSSAQNAASSSATACAAQQAAAQVAASANSSALSAEQSAKDAATSKADAKRHAESAEISKENAEQYAKDANASKESAANSDSEARKYAQDAKSYMDSADNSATSAGKSATDAAGYADAAISAKSASERAAAQANQSAADAAEAAGIAQQHANVAMQSASSASASAADAAASANDAHQNFDEIKAGVEEIESRLSESITEITNDVYVSSIEHEGSAEWVSIDLTTGYSDGCFDKDTKMINWTGRNYTHHIFGVAGGEQYKINARVPDASIALLVFVNDDNDIVNFFPNPITTGRQTTEFIVPNGSTKMYVNHSGQTDNLNSYYLWELSKYVIEPPVTEKIPVKEFVIGKLYGKKNCLQRR